MQSRSLGWLILASALLPLAAQAQKIRPSAVVVPKRETPTAPDLPKDRSHSKHGAAFNQGPRQLARPLRGVGNVHFPITTAKPEAQRYFDQGINLLYSFFYFEAERAFRHAAMLDPDCAMAYWGLARTDSGRGKEFLQLARKKIDRCTERERRYIEAEEIRYRETKDEKARERDHIRALEQLALDFPNDLEAKVILAWTLKNHSEGGSMYRAPIDALLRDALAKNPMHPGAHHYRIHLWDVSKNADQALDSCRLYSKAAPAIGHALHMPGHIYAQLGRWEEAAYAMDAAARAERRYFYEQGQQPWESWNYAHDQHYLIANLGYAGRIREGIELAQELLDLPYDPKHNTKSGWSLAGQGRFAMMRMLVRGERWSEILKQPELGWTDEKEDKSWRAWMLGLAYIATGSLEKAREQAKVLEELKVEDKEIECARLELKGRLAVTTGDYKAGLEALQKAVEIEKTHFAYNDPTPYPRPLYEVLAWGYLRANRPEDAIASVREGLQREPNNGFAICLLLEAQLAANKPRDANETFERLRGAWRYADADLPLPASIERHIAACRASGKATSFRRPYRPDRELERTGPARWRPFAAPDFRLTDPDGKIRTLADFGGKPMLLVFHLGVGCDHCMSQLITLGKEKAAFEALGLQLVAVSKDTPQTHREFLAQKPNYPFLTLSDSEGKAAQAYKARDDFENLDLHCTLLIDAQGRVWWFNSSSEPFTDVAFLKREAARMNAWAQKERTLSKR